MGSSVRCGVLLGVLALLSPAVHAQNNDGTPGTTKESDGARFETGVALRFLPVGWFDMFDVANRDFRAYPALGFALFVDRRLHRYFSVGASPEVTLNVIPNRSEYSAGRMVALAARLQAQYPGRVVEPYAIATAGYSILWREGTSRASGPVVGASLGLRLRFAKRHAVFGELGYQKGFQQVDGRAYAPSYLITGAGWQVGF
jgi:hypothetical protein